MMFLLPKLITRKTNLLRRSLNWVKLNEILSYLLVRVLFRCIHILFIVIYLLYQYYHYLPSLYLIFINKTIIKR